MSNHQRLVIEAQKKAIIQKVQENRWLIADSTIESLLLWQAYGIEPGDFLMGVLKNDLRQAFAHADAFNRHHVGDVVCVLENYFPWGCWGSEDKVKSWKGEFNENKGGHNDSETN